jgi:hypothetical protein
MTAPQPEPHAERERDETASPDTDWSREGYEEWRDLQEVLEERDREWWAEADTSPDADADA